MARVAVASSDGTNIDEHFGRAQDFLIYEVAEDGTYQQLEIRAITPHCSCGEEAAAAHPSDAAVELLSDVEAVLVNQIGPGAVRMLEAKGIRAFSLKGSIDKALTSYGKRRTLLENHIPGVSQCGTGSGGGGCGCSSKGCK